MVFVQDSSPPGPPRAAQRHEKIGIQGDLVWTVFGPAESARRGHDVSRGFHLRRPSESLGEPSQVRPTVVSSPRPTGLNPARPKSLSPRT